MMRMQADGQIKNCFLGRQSEKSKLMAYVKLKSLCASMRMQYEANFCRLYHKLT